MIRLSDLPIEIQGTSSDINVKKLIKPGHHKSDTTAEDKTLVFANAQWQLYAKTGSTTGAVVTGPVNCQILAKGRLYPLA
ncbi:hypothetical protein AXFE_07550 [Acidithrix ferrooxidans]|uniref:Uncharacterized protein n=1 Tax=Acidithrix ferrooxidans TaxID=1280514 RepID=A0A0D8HKW0_9ACTN|nr:hypothetical protein AXFE_07550 [Acidithrix ferrooxidans]